MICAVCDGPSDPKIQLSLGVYVNSWTHRVWGGMPGVIQLCEDCMWRLDTAAAETISSIIQDKEPAVPETEKQLEELRGQALAAYYAAKKTPSLASLNYASGLCRAVSIVHPNKGSQGAFDSLCGDISLIIKSLRHE